MERAGGEAAEAEVVMNADSTCPSSGQVPNKVGNLEFAENPAFSALRRAGAQVRARDALA
jgi:hypothetical protein